MVYNFLCKDEKHAEISTYFCLKHECGKKSAIFPYSVSKQKPRDYPPCIMKNVINENIKENRLYNGSLRYTFEIVGRMAHSTILFMHSSGVV